MTPLPSDIASDRDLLQRLRGIRALVLDVDGVLTDGRLYYSAEGEVLKVFHVRDGHGIVELRRAGIEVAVLSGRAGPSVTTRMRELGVRHVRQGISDKAAEFADLLDAMGVSASEVCYVGDDVPDLEVLRQAGFAATVADAHPEVKAAVHWQTRSPGGHGAVREICDLLQAARGAHADSLHNTSNDE